jgi:hypothetical protein
MEYEIKDYSYNQADRLGVYITPSHKKNKKIDVYKKDKNTGEHYYCCSIGDKRYKDFPTFWEEEGPEKAIRRRKAYHNRHQAEKASTGSPGYYAYYILW